MSEDMLIRFCSPTLAGIKSASLFSCACESRKELLADVRRLNRILTKKGLRLIPMRMRGGRALIYLYQPDRLEKDLYSLASRELLREKGYETTDVIRCLGILRKKLQSQEGFPHEIGLFLSYPPEDVRGFINEEGEGCKLTGCWKVYGDEETARKTFQTYHHCTECYSRQWKKGVRFERLVVPAVRR